MAIDPTDTSDARLPDDLQFISEQLADDADQLARTFPTNAPQNWRRAFAAAVALKTDPEQMRAPVAGPEQEQRLRVLFVGVVAAAALMIIATGWYSTSRSPQQNTATEDPISVKHAQKESRRPGKIVPAGVMPALGVESFHSFSLPEQEALIDVLQTHGIPEPNVQY